MEKTSLKNNETLSANSCVVFSELSDGEGVLLHMDSKLYYSLNPTGSFMWRILEKKEGTQPTHLVDQLVDRYKISQDLAQADVQEFLRDLLSEQLIQKNAPGKI
jgi:hypothetical protein